MILFERYKFTKYFITKEGNVFSRSLYNGSKELHKKTLTLNKKRGYLYVRTATRNYAVHRLVAEFFLKKINGKNCVNHIDSNRLNNDVKNLEWVTHKENTAHAILKGNIKLFKKNYSANLKYTNKQCAEVVMRVESGMTYVNAGSIYKMPYSTVAHLIRKTRRKI